PSPPFNVIPGVSAPLIVEHSHEYKINQNLLLSWDKSLTSTSGFHLKAYYDFTRYVTDIIGEDRHSFDVDFRHWLDLNSSNSLIYGFNFNSTRDKITPSTTVDIRHMRRQDLTYSAFMQNTTKLNDALSLMIGSKFEHNNYTGVEIQPSIRMTYNYSDDTTFWTSWSRAIRRPSRTGDDLIFNETIEQTIPNPFPSGGLITLPFSATIYGDSDQNSEELLAYEAGIRTELWDQKLTLDLVTFYNDYSHLSTFEPTSDPSVVVRDDKSHADAYGVEFTLKLLASKDLDIIANYTWFKLQFPNADTATVDDTPQHLFNFQTNYQLCKNLNWHTVVYYTDAIGSQEIPSYIRVDSGLVWKINNQSSLAVWGKNLTDPQHPEYNDTIFNSFTYEISRSFFVEYNYNF
ncbi:MAG: TonB-dependent receptor, partial [Lentisphaeraceae bacterium]|nr:TonB-dependent receptor [Lentisphaeraceae bacterium]